MSQRRHRRSKGNRKPFAGGTIRRFLEPVLILFLRQGANHGYELINALAPFGMGHVATGPVYRTLRELEATGLVESEWDTESSGGPARRVYCLTEAGHRYLADWVENLRETDNLLRRFLTAYDQHMKRGAGEYH
jgi:poly-beta-hydroxybutyrate-responsive repressor